MSHPGGTPHVPTNQRINQRSLNLPRAASWLGLFALAIGLIQVAWASKDLLSLASAHDPRTELQLDLLLTQGAFAAVSGGVLSIGAFAVLHSAKQTRLNEGPSRASTETSWHGTLLAVAILVVLGVVALSFLPTPARDVAFSPRDFQPLAQPTNVTSDGAYRVSRNFWADQGGVLAADVQITWTDNRTGGVLFSRAPGNFEVYAASASSPRESPMLASSFVAPSDGFYVLIVWLGRCPKLTTGECANTTAAVQAQVVGTVPTIYVPAQLGGSVFGPALVAVSVVGSRAQRRRLLP